ncbi:hormogonium polysaccharide biosynthesis protein HpsA [[Phormidium] sp. ETS-05]|uniref:hormogonium polysaccharide biosynthesis protein HpsA n=1 Tax=[Phormidium] sp. ETS-05 TaxID=222819 RepID=UPI0018EF24BF|nr:hormogonium polysaccharide biosynthesis protein HpsA [[Phormidium] sp. ETS-05]
MSTRHRGKLNRLIYYWWLQIAKRASRIGKSFRNLLLQPLQLLKPGLKRQEAAGFVLPTITMIMLVVVLVVSAIVLRSFDRANNARNIRVNQAVLAAAQPALDRANAKLNYLLGGEPDPDPSIPPTTPTDLTLYQALLADDYTFGDEDRLKVRYDIDGDGTPLPKGADDDSSTIEDNEEIKTAWRFPIDTDNNGKFDTFTLYGIYLKTPTRDETTGEFNTARSPLDARTPPMPPVEAGSNAACAGALGTSASLVGDSGWYKSDAKLKKSFYVFAVNVPITALGTLDPNKYETGKSGFSALEYQQDRSRIPLTNNAVVYDNDLEVTPGVTLRLNGRIQANSNFIVSYTGSGTTLDFYQVSSPESCFYDQENSKIVVGGNVINGKSDTTADRRPVAVHLFNGAGASPNTSPRIENNTSGGQSVGNTSLQAQYNNNAYEQRIACLLEAQIGDPANPTPESNDPKAVTEAVEQKLDENPSLDRAKVRRQELEAYFRNRTRQVPFAEVADGANAISGAPAPPADQAPWCRQNASSVLAGSNDTLRPIDSWIWPTDFSGGVARATGPTNLNLVQLPATEFGKQKNLGKEQYLGDRVLVGNNLPAVWWNGSKFAEGPPNPPETDNLQTLNENWTDPNNEPRTRATRVRKIPEVGAIDRDGFWEKSAAVKPQTAVSGRGGLRIITSGGVYERLNSFLPPPPAPANDPITTEDESKFIVVWPDTMPMSPGLKSAVYDNDATVWKKPDEWNGTPPDWLLTTTNSPPKTPTIDPSTPKYAKGDLRMRATAVYHYAQDPIDPPENTDPNKDTDQQPIACISSYYDPTDFETARNAPGLPDVSGWGPPSYTKPTGAAAQSAKNKSNNGVAYPKPTTARPTSASYNSTTGLFTGSSELEKQANMVFPDGRFANKPLREALKKLANSEELTLADQSAIDSTLCALDILAGNISPNNSVIPHGAIKEISFLNPREIKALDKDDPATTVDETFTLNSPLYPDAQAANLTGLYDQPIEERQPLEIRVTQIDLHLLRNQTISLASNIKGPNPEYLLPSSGIIYATRDDALPDRSYRSISDDGSKLISPTDFRLDPTRRPNGIMLINGRFLARNDGNNDGQNDTDPAKPSDVVKEKGIILVSNEPVYVQGNFNLHNQEEFDTALNGNWSNFYTRTISNIDENFACRQNDPRISQCTQGDTWRPATVLADAVTLLSDNFRPGFRNEGDFDLRNNAGNPLVLPDGGYDIDGNGTIGTNTVAEVAIGLDLNSDGDTTDTVAENQISVGAARRLNGFLANDYAVNGLSMGGSPAVRVFDLNGNGRIDTSGTTDNTPTDERYATAGGSANLRLNSSYFNNFVTPVQRRGEFPEYVMEICRKLPVSTCQPEDWVVGTLTVPTAKASDIAVGTPVSDLLSGTTALPPQDPADQRYPRRVAFKRNANNQLTLNNNLPIPLGINTTGNLEEYPYSSGGALPRIVPNALRFKTTKNTGTINPTTNGNAVYGNDRPLFYVKQPLTGTTEQPLLVPILQLYISNNNAPPSGDVTAFTTLMTSSNPNNERTYTKNQTYWQPRVTQDHTFNLIVGAKDVPARTYGNNPLTATTGETNGGLQNLPRFMENWLPSTANSRTTNILGSFIQLGRSEYATAPYQPLRGNASIFGFNHPYSNFNSTGRIPYFNPPNRNWGYDIGLLSQPPDLFAEKFTDKPSTDVPSEFFREVRRDDDWVKTLLCAVEDKSGKYAVSEDQRPTEFCIDKTGGL